MRSRSFRSGGGRSSRASEVVGIFLVSIFVGMIISGVAVAIDFVFRTLFG